MLPLPRDAQAVLFGSVFESEFGVTQEQIARIQSRAMLAGWRLLLRQDEFSLSRDAQAVFLIAVLQSQLGLAAFEEVFGIENLHWLVRGLGLGGLRRVR